MEAVRVRGVSKNNQYNITFSVHGRPTEQEATFQEVHLVLKICTYRVFLVYSKLALGLHLCVSQYQLSDTKEQNQLLVLLRTSREIPHYQMHLTLSEPRFFCRCFSQSATFRLHYYNWCIINKYHFHPHFNLACLTNYLLAWFILTKNNRDKHKKMITVP